MGLDMYAYAAAREGQYREYWDGATLDKEGQSSNPNVGKPLEIAYWRKHPNLHGWFEQLWRAKGSPGVSEDTDHMFNGIELELTKEDLDSLEAAVKEGQLPNTKGFFFGDPSDNYYYEDDLNFIKEARANLFLGLKVFYNSSW